MHIAIRALGVTGLFFVVTATPVEHQHSVEHHHDDCEEPPEFALTNTLHPPRGKTIQYLCVDGYRMVHITGAHVVVKWCNNGEWFGPDPVCKKL